MAMDTGLIIYVLDKAAQYEDKSPFLDGSVLDTVLDNKLLWLLSIMVLYPQPVPLSPLCKYWQYGCSVGFAFKGKP